MMQRNLNSRVEAMTPLEDAELQRRLEEILQVCLADDSLSWELDGAGTWTKVPTTYGLNTHLRLESLALSRAAGASADPEHASDTEDVVVAAGGIVHRGTTGELEVLIAHRPRYDDWSFPKGKLVDGEGEAEAALREVHEETGYACELGREIGAIEYLDPKDRRKVVRYWAMQVVSGEFAENDEVDEIRWLDIDEALDALTYDRDRALLRTFVDVAES